MRGLKFVILGVAVAAGVGAVALVQNELERARQSAVIVQAPVDAAPEQVQTAVLVAVRDLPRGTRLTEEHFRWQDWPADAVGERFITRDDAPNGLDFEEGNLLVRAEIVAGEPITEAKLVALDHPGVLSAMIRPGMRAFAVSLEVESGAGGFILPGDYVDVILTRSEDVPELGPDGAWGTRTVLFTDTLLRTVRVLAVDRVFQADGDTASTDIRDTATLEVTPQMVELLALAESAGRVTLALRSVTELVDAQGQVIFDPIPTLAVDLEAFAGASLGGGGGAWAQQEPDAQSDEETPPQEVVVQEQGGQPSERVVTVIRWSTRSEARFE